jgi:hypothetical protein
MFGELSSQPGSTRALRKWRIIESSSELPVNSLTAKEFLMKANFLSRKIRALQTGGTPLAITF